jgi:hypothetical protein
MNVIALVEKACLRPVIGPQLFECCADVIDGISGEVVAVGLAADEPVAFGRPTP